jgi:hypothetical protein
MRPSAILDWSALLLTAARMLLIAASARLGAVSKPA